MRGGGKMFEIEFAQPARKHVQSLRKRDQRIILDAIESRLRDQPDQPV